MSNMSKLDDILDRLQEQDDRLIADVKADITDLMIEIVSETDFAYKDATAYANVVKKKVKEL